ncbi:hypothetical protein SEA_LEOPARD_53 [Mycobacterium phage Leopard]|nr:hypothetical protein SEA_LEOPARD_53 [Mycobacterium phage Leopard]
MNKFEEGQAVRLIQVTDIEDPTSVYKTREEVLKFTGDDANPNVGDVGRVVVATPDPYILVQFDGENYEFVEDDFEAVGAVEYTVKGGIRAHEHSGKAVFLHSEDTDGAAGTTKIKPTRAGSSVEVKTTYPRVANHLEVVFRKVFDYVQVEVIAK